MNTPTFEWDEDKDFENQKKHGVSFAEAQHAFYDPDRVIAHDEAHSTEEERLFCVGDVKGRILTVRFTYRRGIIRIIGAGEWRKWRKFYEQQKKRH